MFVDFFIRRPVFATVCSLLIILAGAIAIPTLSIAQFPVLAPPQVTVSANYTGANAQAVESGVTTLLEQAINGAEGMRYMASSSGNDGSSSITATFKLDRSLDIAAVDVQNRASTAQGRLARQRAADRRYHQQKLRIVCPRLRRVFAGQSLRPALHLQLS